jgi:DnaK suppressor protein
VETQRAQGLLQNELRRLRELLVQAGDDGWHERSGANEQGDMSDSAEPLVAEQEEAAVAAGLRERLSAIERAQQRLIDGTYGLSVRSGEPIPDERLEADPAAELTVDEAQSERYE